MSPKYVHAFVSAAVFSLGGLTLGGCASNSSSQATVATPATPAQPAAMNVPGVARTASAADGLRTVSNELSTVRQTIGDTLASLQTISTANGSLYEPFERFLSLREQLEQDEKRMSQRGDEMRNRARDYITNWEVEVYGVEDKDLRAQAEQRRNAVRQNYTRISDSARSLRESFDPFRRDLHDIETFLSNDLTPAGVRAASASIQRANTNGQEVQRRIDAVIAELQRVATAMTPSVTQPADGGTLAPGYSAPAAGEQNK